MQNTNHPKPFNKLPVHIDKVGGLTLPQGVFLCWECGSYYDDKYECHYCRNGLPVPMQIYEYDDPEETVFVTPEELHFEYGDYVYELPKDLPIRTKQLFIKRFTDALDTLPAESIPNMFNWFPKHFNPVFEEYKNTVGKKQHIKVVLEEIKARAAEFTFKKGKRQ